MPTKLCCLVGALLAAFATSLGAAELTWADITPKGDGPDNKGNTADDAWQFWFELAHKPNHYHPLDTFSSTIPKTGIPRKVRGPIASMLPSPDGTDGWIFHRDWDGRFEGVWADRKTRQVLVYPYVEKTFHGAVAITYRIPADGTYDVSGGVTDLQVAPQFPQHDGIVWHLDLTDDGVKPGKRLASGTPIGDGGGRPDSGTFAAKNVDAKKNQFIRLVIHPRQWWGSDLTRIDAFRIEPRQGK